MSNLMTPFGIPVIALVSISVQAAGFQPPEVGKFKSCKYGRDCDSSINCETSAPSCDYIPSTIEECSTVWDSLKTPFGISTKIPKTLCISSRNTALFECEKVRSLKISQCEYRKNAEVELCLASAEREEVRCENVLKAEIEASSELLSEFEKSITKIEIVQNFELSEESRTILGDILSTKILDKVRFVRSKSYDDFWSFAYDKSKYVDWNEVPSSGYGSIEDFKAIGSYVVLSPTISESPNLKIQIYGALHASLADQLGLDGLSQIYTHMPGLIEQYIVSEIEIACSNKACS